MGGLILTFAIQYHTRPKRFSFLNLASGIQ